MTLLPCLPLAFGVGKRLVRLLDARLLAGLLVFTLGPGLDPAAKGEMSLAEGCIEARRLGVEDESAGMLDFAPRRRGRGEDVEPMERERTS